MFFFNHFVSGSFFFRKFLILALKKKSSFTHLGGRKFWDYFQRNGSSTRLDGGDFYLPQPHPPPQYSSSSPPAPTPNPIFFPTIPQPHLHPRYFFHLTPSPTPNPHIFYDLPPIPHPNFTPIPRVFVSSHFFSQ